VIADVEIVRGMGRGGFYRLDREEQVYELALHRVRSER